MAIHFIIGWIEEFTRFNRVRCMNIFAFNHPDTDAFVSASVYITCIFYCHLCICGIKASRMLMVKALAGADEYFPEWPVFAMRFGFHATRYWMNNFFSIHALTLLRAP